MVRPIFMFNTFMGFLYEMTHPDAIIKLIESCYMFRHEEKLVAEEESYRMIQEIFRSPELLKSLTGSSLKGTCDPILDNLDEEEKKKLERLFILEQKGFEVEKLKERILSKNKKQE